MKGLREKWEAVLGTPSYDRKGGAVTREACFSGEGFSAEWYRQESGNGRAQRVLMLIPSGLVGKAPAVAVPFYFPEAMLGYDPVTDEDLSRYQGIEMMLHLVRRGYVVISADAYHLSYIDSDKKRSDFSRWGDAAAALHAENPHYSGMGKLLHDTQLLIDLLSADARVDAARIGIAGHSLGGKMAFYAGCLDERIGAILASDFGIGWHQTNWDAEWYFGKDAARLAAEGYEHAELLSIGKKPFCLIAGLYDTDESHELACRFGGYGEGDARFAFINHATGHRPPEWALEEGYAFLDKWLKNEPKEECHI